ncbi:MAG: hypothetical protein V2A76_15785, partial [Planctomycetota bacterium]
MRWLLSLALLAAVLFLWYGLRSVPPVDVASLPGAEQLVAPVPREQPGRSSEAEEGIAAPGDVTRDAAGIPMQTFEGSVIVRFLGGPPVDDASGSFQLTSVIDDQNLKESIQVREGCFRAQVPVGAKMYAWRPRLDGKAARLRRPELLP